jgi:hypothetical protein
MSFSLVAIADASLPFSLFYNKNGELSREFTQKRNPFPKSKSLRVKALTCFPLTVIPHFKRKIKSRLEETLPTD